MRCLKDKTMLCPALPLQLLKGKEHLESKCAASPPLSIMSTTDLIGDILNASPAATKPLLIAVVPSKLLRKLLSPHFTTTNCRKETNQDDVEKVEKMTGKQLAKLSP